MCDHAAHEIGLTLSIEHGQMGVEDIDPGRISNRQLDRTSDRDIAGLEYAQIPRRSLTDRRSLAHSPIAARHVPGRRVPRNSTWPSMGKPARR